MNNSLAKSNRAFKTAFVFRRAFLFAADIFVAFGQTLSLLAPLAARAAAAEGEDFVVVEDVEEVMVMP